MFISKIKYKEALYNAEKRTEDRLYQNFYRDRETEERRKQFLELSKRIHVIEKHLKLKEENPVCPYAPTNEV